MPDDVLERTGSTREGEGDRQWRLDVRSTKNEKTALSLYLSRFTCDGQCSG